MCTNLDITFCRHKSGLNDAGVGRSRARTGHWPLTVPARHPGMQDRIGARVIEPGRSAVGPWLSTVTRPPHDSNLKWRFCQYYTYFSCTQDKRYTCNKSRCQGWGHSGFDLDVASLGSRPASTVTITVADGHLGPIWSDSPGPSC